MNGKKAAAVALLLAWLALSLPIPAASQSGIIVTGADSVLTVSSTYSSELVDTTQSIGPRVITEYAKSGVRHALTEMPTALQTLIDAISAMVVVEYANSTDPHPLVDLPIALEALVDAVSAMVIVEYANSTDPHPLVNLPTALDVLVTAVSGRVIVQYANSTDPHVLVDLPTALQALVGTVPDRVVVEYANSTRGMGFTYPPGLMNDTQPPEITGVSATVFTTGTATIAWTTDEFANSLVFYGRQPGAYTHVITDALYVKAHTLTLTGLTSGGTYYYRVRSVDRSGNASESPEYSFTVGSPAPPTFSISGHVRDGSGDPISGVTVSAGAGGSATTDASGAYTVTNVVTGTYTVTPSKSGHVFSPATRTVSVPPDATGQDFTGSSVTLSVSLSANPSEGTAPLNGVDLTAEVSGSAVGTINYTFYCNRSDSGTDITPGWAAKFEGILDNPKTAEDLCNYSSAGTYTAKVIAERGTKQAEDRVTITVPPQPDKTPPSGNITSPADNSTVGPGTVYLAADAWDDSGGSGIQRVEFWVYYNGKWHKAKYDYISPYSVNWPIPDGLASQDIEIGIHVVDNAGNVAIDPGGKRTIEYVKSSPDTTPPSGNITSPADNSTAGPGTLRLTADAWDNPGGSGIHRVEFWVYYNGNWHQAGDYDYISPYSVNWRIPDGLASQNIEIGIHVVDNAGNVAIDPGDKRTVKYVKSSPDTTPPSGNITSPADNTTVGPGTVHLAAEAWDNPGGSGIKRVEFWVYYNDNWHQAGDYDNTSPYSVDWRVPDGLASQDIEIGIHVVDNAGNVAIDPGGKRTVKYMSSSTSRPVPYIHQLWSTGDDFHGDWSCGPSSLGMLLAWYNVLTPTLPWGATGYPKFWSSYSWYVMNEFDGFRDLKAWDAKNAITCTGRYAGLHGASRFTGRLNDDCQGPDRCGCYVAGWEPMADAIKQMELSIVNNNYSARLTKEDLKELVNAGKPTLISTRLCNSEGHVVLVRGYNENTSTFIVSDPNGKCNGDNVWNYDEDADGRAVQYTWDRLRVKGIYIEMREPILGGAVMLSGTASFDGKRRTDLSAGDCSTQALLTLSEPGYSRGFFTQTVSFDPRDGHLRLPMPDVVAPGFYDVSIKPTYRLAAQKSMPVYGSEIDIDFSDASPNAFALGDIDYYGGDNVINILDTGALMRHWNQSVAMNPKAQRADLNGDGTVNADDLSVLNANYGKQGEGPFGILDESQATKGASTLKLLPQATNPNVGDIFTVDIYLDTMTSTYGAEVVLYYDPTFLEVQDSDPAQPGVQITPSTDVYSIHEVNRVDPVAGRIELVSRSEPGATPRKGGALGTIAFKALAPARQAEIKFDFFPGLTSDSNVVAASSALDDLAGVTNATLHVDGDDHIPPTGTLTINEGQDYTNQTQVGLTLHATDAYGDVTHMRFSDDGISWDDWGPLAYDVTRAIPAGDGVKTVYAELKDAANNSTVVSATITLDTVAPTGTIRLVNVEEGGWAVYHIAADDDPGEVDKMIISQDALFADAEWGDFLGANLIASTSAGEVIYARLIDKAGNVSDVLVLQLLAADFIATPRCGAAPLTAHFIDNSLGDITGWQWDFGDGGTSIRQSPIYTYSQIGTYTVTLTVSGVDGSHTLARTSHIHVTADGQCNTASMTIVNEGTDVTFTGDLEDFALADGGSITFDELSVNSYTIIEVPSSFPDQNWHLADVTCEDGNGQLVPVNVDRNNFKADIPLQLDQHLTCTFVNERVEERYSVYLPIVVKQSR